MPRVLQVSILMCLLWAGVCLPAAAADKAPVYKRVELGTPVFVRGVSMLGREQDEYATNLTAHALMVLRGHGKRHVDEAKLARKMIGLALHLSPRNDHAGKVNERLAKGENPGRVRSDYSPKVFARLLLTRAKILSESHLKKDVLLSRYFLELSVLLDSDSREARYYYQKDQQGNGPVDWALITESEDK